MARLPPGRRLLTGGLSLLAVIVVLHGALEAMDQGNRGRVDGGGSGGDGG